MQIRYCRWLAVLSVGLWWTLPVRGEGQQVGLGRTAGTDPAHPSYVEIQPPDKDLDPTLVVQKRLAQAQGLTDLQELARSILNDKNLRELLLEQARDHKLPFDENKLREWRGLLANKELPEDLKKQLKNPAVQQLLEKQLDAAKQSPPGGPEMDAAKYRRALEALKALKQDEPPPAEGDGPTAVPIPGRGGPIPSPGGSPPSPPGRGTSTPGTDGPPDQDGPTADSQVTDWVVRQMERLRDVRGPLRDSPALQQMIRNLTRSLMDGKSADGQTNGFKRLLEAAQNSRLLSKGTWDRIHGLSLPHVPMPNLPKVNMPAVALPPLGPPGAVGPGRRDGGSMIVPVAFVLGLAAVLLWRVLRGSAESRADGGERRWRLGPWPVDPRTVATRADLVRAFEHLSLLKLGPAARHWNHLEIAAGLGGREADRRIVADHLASLYEHARYAPDGEALPPESVLAARRELLFLAGVTPA
jgi:hypothetical protein